MTASEAIEALKKMNLKPTHPFNEARNKAVEALEKQIPKKPYEETIATEDGYLAKKRSFFYWCPNCFYHLNENQNYCDDCGQALDWSET